MREILFRGKRTDNGEWAYGDLLNVGVDYDYAIRTYGGREHGQVNAVNENTIGQCTGLTDKNGKKVFEGDIVDTPDRLILVEWLRGNAQFDLKFIRYAHDKRITNFKGIEMRDLSYYEVIGNIHDNPELLKGGV